MKKNNIVYLIADFKRGEEVIEEALKASVDYIQLREKNISTAEYLKRAKRIKEIAMKYDTPLIINDRIDIAMLVHADGVHLGQDDVAIEEARRVLGENAIIGATAKTVEQAVKAQKEGADYIGSGAWFATSTKRDAIPITKETYVDILKYTTIPNVAVGGISEDNCHIPLRNGANGVAISAGILDSNNIYDTVQKIRRILNVTN